MATHKLFKGGVAPAGAFNATGAEAAEPVNWDGVTVSAQKTPASFAISWSLAPAQSLFGDANKDGWLDQKAWFDQNPLLVGDTIEAVLIPPFSAIQHIFYRSEATLTGAQFQVEVEDIETGTVVPVDTIDLSTAPFHFLDSIVPTLAPNTPPRYIGAQGGKVRMRVAALPATFEHHCIRLGMSVAGLLFDRGDLIVEAPGTCA